MPYTPIAVTPGNLNSYTPEVWNKRVHDLGYREGEAIVDDKIATQELKQYMQSDSETKGDEIDVNSGCWRIVFVVTNIQYKDPNDPNSYQYRDKLSGHDFGLAE